MPGSAPPPLNSKKSSHGINTPKGNAGLRTKQHKDGDPGPLTLDWAEEKAMASAALTKGSQPTGISDKPRCE